MEFKGAVILTVTLLTLEMEECFEFNLTSEPSLSQPVCQGRVVFTCTGIAVPSAFSWELNNSDISSFTFDIDPSIMYPLELPVIPSLAMDGVVMRVVNATVNSLVPNSIDVISTLNVSDLSVLEGLPLHCQGSFGRRSNTIITEAAYIARPPAPDFNCSIRSTPDGPLILSLCWDLEFNSEHTVDRYRVMLTPDPLSCSSNQVPPSEDYICSGLDPETDFAVSAINCGDQEGTSTPPMVFGGPAVPVDIEITDQSLIMVQWNEGVARSDSGCLMDGIIVNYTVVIVDSSDVIVNEVPGNCTEGVCHATFPSMDNYCRVSINASNIFGDSSSELVNIIGDSLTSANRDQLIAGVLILCMALAVGVALSVIEFWTEKGSRLSLFLLLIGGTVLLLPVVFWVSVGFHVGLEDNICDSAWQSTRDILIILALTFSVSVLLFFVAAALMFMLSCYIDKQGEKHSKAIFEVQILKPRKRKHITDHNANTMELERYNMSEPASRQTPGGVIHEGERVGLVDVCAKPGQSRDDLMLQKGEEYFQKYGSPEKVHYATPEGTLPTATGVPVDKECSKTEQINTTNNVSPTTSEEEYSRLTDIGGKEEYDVLRQATGTLPMDEVYAELEKGPCISFWKYQKFLHHQSDHPTLDQVAEWLPGYRKWSIEDLNMDNPLKVYFMNHCPDKWRYMNGAISFGVVMQFVKDTWHGAFTIGNEIDSQIRVEFQDEAYGSWSVLGSIAKHVAKDKPTMSFNFSNMKSEDIKITIIHQFGHALGFGHAMMRPEDWEVLKEFVDIKEMVRCYDARNEEDFEVLWTGKELSEDVVNYDEGSVMQYSTLLAWLNKEALQSKRHKKKLATFKKHASLPTTGLSLKDLETFNRFMDEPGRSDITVQYLISVENKAKETFRLTRKAASGWKKIGEKLGIKKTELSTAEETFESDEERLNMIWHMWYNRGEYEYPFSWAGLRNLFEDSGIKTVASEYFKFLNNI